MIKALVKILDNLRSTIKVLIKTNDLLSERMDILSKRIDDLEKEK